MNEDQAPLTPARFAALADAYGGDMGRWPEAERAAAFRSATDPAMQAILHSATALDTHLDRWFVEPPPTKLKSVIVQSWRRPLSRRAKLWWASIGIATALAGAAAGSIAAAAAVPTEHAMGEEATAFGDLAGQGV